MPTAPLEELLSQSWYPKAPALPEPEGEVIRAATVNELYAAVAAVESGGTVLVADGHYAMHETLVLATDGVTLRSESGDRTAVVLDFAGSASVEGIAFTGCRGATLADLTVQNVMQNGIKINSDQGACEATIHNVVGHNVWQRHVKAPKMPFRDGRPTYVDDCRVQFCLFYNDRPKQHGDDRGWDDAHPDTGYNYIGGMDVMCTRGWLIRDNVFANIQGGTGGARGTVFIWNGSRDAVIERNISINCNKGVCMGNGHRPVDEAGGLIWPIHCTDVVVRNNFFSGDALDTGVLAHYTQGCKVLHNTCHNPSNTSGRLIHVVADADGLHVANNIVSGSGVRVEGTTGEMYERDNAEHGAAASFADPDHGDLHLAHDIPATVPRLDDVADDIDGSARRDPTSPGAHQPGH